MGPTGEVGIGMLPGNGEGAGDVGGSLVGVECGGGGPPLGEGRGRRGRVGEGEKEVADGGLVGRVPPAVPDKVEVDGGGEDGAHVVPEVDEVGGALVALGGRDGGRR